MFGTCRIPRHSCDQLSVPHPNSPFTRSVTVLVRDWIYAVNVLQDDGSLVEFHVIENRLREVAADVETRLANGETAVPVGLLSSADRDTWAEVRMP